METVDIFRKLVEDENLCEIIHIPELYDLSNMNREKIDFHFNGFKSVELLLISTYIKGEMNSNHKNMVIKLLLGKNKAKVFNNTIIKTKNINVRYLTKKMNLLNNIIRNEILTFPKIFNSYKLFDYIINNSLKKKISI